MTRRSAGYPVAQRGSEALNGSKSGIRCTLTSWYLLRLKTPCLVSARTMRGARRTVNADCIALATKTK